MPAVDEDVIRIKRTVPAPIDRVFAAWTTPADLVRWVWGSLAKDVRAEVDLRPGGRYSTSTACADGGSWGMEGTYERVEPNRCLAYTVEWTAPMGYDSPGERVEVTFTATDGGTEIDFRHEGVPPVPKARETHVQGWNNTFDHLDRVVAGK